MDKPKRRFKRSPRRSAVRMATWVLVTCSLCWLGIVLFQAISLRGSDDSSQGLLPGAEPADLRPALAYEFLQQAAAAQQVAPADECLREHHSLVYVHALRNTMQPVCWPTGDSSTTREEVASTLLCSYRAIGAAEAHCAGTNLALDLHKLKAFFDSSDTSEASAALGAPGLLSGNCAMQHGVSADEARLMAQKLRAQPVLHKFGVMAGDGWYQEGRFGLGGQDWLRSSFQPSSGSTPPVCVAWVEHPLYFLGGRYDPVNVWHGLEDISHAFESYALMGWGADAQIVLLDALDEANLWAKVAYAPLWLKAFSPQHQPTTLRSLVRSTVRKVEDAHRGQLPEGAALCFREATWNVHGGVSLMSRGNNQATPCTNSSMVNAMVDFLLDRLGLAAARPASHGSAANISSMGTPLRVHLERQHRRAATHRKGMAGMGAGGSGAWVLPGLKVVWALRSSRARQQRGILLLLQQKLGVQVEAVDFGTMGIEDQIRLMRRTDVLAGYHGAALTLSLFMPPESALVEVEEEFYRCHCYSNIAAWRNRPYYIISDVSPGRVVDTVQAAANLVSRRLIAQAAARPSAAPAAKVKAHSELDRQATLALLSLINARMELAGSAPSQGDLGKAVRLMQELMEGLGIDTHTGLVDWAGLQALAAMNAKDRQLLSRLAWELRSLLVKHGSDDDVARMSGLLSLLSSHPREDVVQWGALEDLEGAG